MKKRFRLDKCISFISKISMLFSKIFFVVCIILVLIGKIKFSSFMLFGTLIMILFTVYIIALAIIEGNIYNKFAKENLEKKEFEFVDYFWWFDCGPDDIDTYYGYYIIKEIEKGQLYAFDQECVKNAPHEYSSNMTKGYGKDSEPLNIGDKGDFWIEEECKNIFKRKGDFIKLCKFKLKYKKNSLITNNKLYNINPNYDDKLLDNVIFVKGLVEFDCPKK